MKPKSDIPSFASLEEANRVFDEFEGYVTDEAGEYVSESYYDRLTESFLVAFKGEELDEALTKLDELKESAQENIRAQGQTYLRNHNKNIRK